MGLLLDETKSLVPALAEAEPPDVVVHDDTLAWWGRVLAHRWGVPAVETWPNFVSNQHWSMNAYAKLNPLHPRLIVTMVRMAWYLEGEGITDIGGVFRGASAAARIITLPRAFQPAGETFTEGYSSVGPPYRPCFPG